MVASSKGADVLISEPNGSRRAVAERLGLKTADPVAGDVLELVESWTAGAGVDVAFEVSGAEPGLLTATHALRVRGRLLLVGIHSQPVPVDLFRVFWRELDLIGARVYEHDDFEEAVSLLANERIPAGELISAVEPLKRTADAFAALEAGAEMVKVLIDVRR
jgi:threonine dehydrogenase-like Zn-dependent dehydrogenase